MQEDSFRHNLRVKRFPFLKPPAKVSGSSHDEVHRKRSGKPPANPHGLIVLVACVHHHEQIDVAVGGWRSVGVRAKQDDLIGIELLGDFSRVAADRVQSHIGPPQRAERLHGDRLTSVARHGVSLTRSNDRDQVTNRRGA